MKIQAPRFPRTRENFSKILEHEHFFLSLYIYGFGLLEKEFIMKALKKHKGRRRDAANELGISERTLYRKIKEYDINE